MGYIDPLYLRARWYAADTGTFLSIDLVEGDLQRSQSLNGWNYAEGNPVLYTDPNGLIVCLYGHNDDGSCASVPWEEWLPPLPPSFGVAIATPTVNPQEAAAKAVVLVLGLCVYQVSDQLIDNWPGSITLPGSGTQTQLEPIKATNAQAIAIQTTHQNINEAIAKLIKQNGPVKILYRGTAHKRALEPRNPLFLTESLPYATIFSTTDARPGGDVAAISIYAILKRSFDALLISGDIQRHGPFELKFYNVAQKFLIGPSVIAIPDFYTGQ